jgi:hypothetical protein
LRDSGGNTPYVNNLAKALAIQYDVPLTLLGLWHRHPGSFDKFSSTDDGTNTLYAQLSRNGAISGLVNMDPHFRFTMTLYRITIFVATNVALLM